MEIDSIVLDIDGVLVDVSESYRRSITETIESLCGEEFSMDWVQSLKNSGGFNDDWELTDAGILCILAQRHGYSGTIASLIDQIKKRGGGLSNTRILISELVGKSAENEWNPKTVRALFQSLYLGRDNYFDCFNHEPIINVPGYCLSEKTLVSNKTLNFITKNFQIGVLTGRPSYEANMFLDTIGLKTEEKCILTMETSSQKKPEPGGLISIAKQLNSSNIAFVGDSIDDIQTVVNAKKIDNSRNYFSIGVLTGGISGANGERLLKNSGADEVISSINDLPNILSNSLI